MKKFLSVFICIVTVLSFFTVSSAEETKNYGYLPYIREEAEYSFQTDSSGGIALMSAEELPEKYDSKDYGYVSPVKNQGSDGSCWTFAAIGALESYMLKFYGEKSNGKVINTSEYDFSENHMRYISSAYFNNPLGYEIKVDGGGNTLVSSNYFLNDYGPINESDDMYTTDSAYKTRDYSATRDIPKSDYRVDSVAFIPQYRCFGTDSKKADYIERTKKLVMEYGSAVCGVTYLSDYLNTEETALYCGEDKNSEGKAIAPNHQVLIVGWDDTYSKENFRTAPDSDGAFIIKNSYGTQKNDNGYFYLSYCDYNLFADVMVITSVTPRNDKEILYNIDPYGRVSYMGDKDSTEDFSCVYGNVFRKKSENEILTGISFFAYEGVTYDIYLVESSLNDVLFLEKNYLMFDNGANINLVYEGFVTDNNGYYTIKLDDSVNIEKNEFSIMIMCDYYIPIPCESEVNFIDGTTFIAEEKVKMDEKTSFYLTQEILGYQRLDIFTDAYGVADGNFCIKAITETSEPYAEFELANFTNELGTEKKTFPEGDTVYIVPAMNFANLADKQIICVGYKDNQVKMLNFKNVGGKNRFEFKNIPSDFEYYTFYMYVWGINGLEPVGEGIKVGIE